MTTHVERSIEVEVPVRTAYDQWTQFEDFPRFMGGVQEVRQIGDALTHWVAEIAGIRREWDAAILEQVPDQKVAWAATTGATNAGAVYFKSVGADRTQVRLTLDYEPEGIVEKIGDVLDVVERQAVADLDRFKEFIEKRGTATGGWRGSVDEGDAGSATAAGAVAAGTVAGAAGAAGANTRRTGADDVPGDVVAVGPTGGTHSTVTTESGPAHASTGYRAEGEGVGHSGDPVAVDTQRSSTRTAADDTGTAGPTADAAVSPSTGVTGFGTDTGLSSDDPASGAFTGNPEAGTASHGGSRGSAGTGTAGPTADAAASPSTGVTGFGTDTGLSSDDPASGAFTGNPDGGTAHSRTADPDAGAGSSAGRSGAAWTDGPGARSGTTESTTDPVGESWSADDTGRGQGRSAESDFADRDRDERTDADPGVVRSDFVDRDITEQGAVQGAFAGGAIRDEDVPTQGFATGMGGARDATGTEASLGTPTRSEQTTLDNVDAPGTADGVGGSLDPLDPRAGTADDPQNPTRPSV